MGAPTPFPYFREDVGNLSGAEQGEIVLEKWSEAARVYAENEALRQLLIDWINKE